MATRRWCGGGEAIIIHKGIGADHLAAVSLKRTGSRLYVTPGS